MKPLYIKDKSVPLKNRPGETLTFQVWPRVRRSGFEHLVLQTTIDLMEKGFITTINHEPDHMLFGMSDLHGRALSYIVLEPRGSQESAHVILGGTVPDYRGEGLYQKLYFFMAQYIELNSFETGSRMEHVRKITGAYHVNNESARRMNDALGRTPVRVQTEQSVMDAINHGL